MANRQPVVFDGNRLQRIASGDIIDPVFLPAAGGIAGFGPPPIVSSTDWSLIAAQNAINRITAVIAGGRALYTPFIVGRAITLTDVGVFVSTAGAGTTIDIAVHEPDASTMLPSARIGIVQGLDSETTGFKSGSMSVALQPGLFWFGVWSNGTPTIHHLSKTAAIAFGSSNTPTGSTTVTVGAFKDNSGLTDPAPSGLLTHTANVPAVFVKFV